MPEEPTNQPVNQQPPIYSQPPTNNPTTTPSMTGPNPPKKKSKKGLVIGIAAAAVLAIGGSAAAYNLWYQNPDKVLLEAVLNTVSAKNASYTGSFELASNDNTPEKNSLKISFDGKKSGNAGDLNAKADIEFGEQKYSLNGSALLDNDTNLYFKLDNVREQLEKLTQDMGEIPPEIDTIITKIDGNWIKISSDDLKDIDENLSTTQTCTEDTLKKLENNKSQKQELIDVYQANKFVFVDEKLGAENGSLGYTLGYNEDAAKNFARELEKTSLYKELKKCDDSFEVKEDDLTIDGEEQESTTRTEVWISRFDHKFTKIKVNSVGKTDTMNFEVNPTFDGTVEVTPPENSISIKDLQQDLENALGAFMFGGQDDPYTASDTPLEYNFKSDFKNDIYIEQN